MCRKTAAKLIVVIQPQKHTHTHHTCLPSVYAYAQSQRPVPAPVPAPVPEIIQHIQSSTHTQNMKNNGQHFNSVFFFFPLHIYISDVLYIRFNVHMYIHPNGVISSCHWRRSHFTPLQLFSNPFLCVTPCFWLPLPESHLIQFGVDGYMCICIIIWNIGMVCRISMRYIHLYHRDVPSALHVLLVR